MTEREFLIKCFDVMSQKCLAVFPGAEKKYLKKFHHFSYCSSNELESIQTRDLKLYAPLCAVKNKDMNLQSKLPTEIMFVKDNKHFDVFKMKKLAVYPFYVDMVESQGVLCRDHAYDYVVTSIVKDMFAEFKEQFNVELNGKNSILPKSFAKKGISPDNFIRNNFLGTLKKIDAFEITEPTGLVPPPIATNQGFVKHLRQGAEYEKFNVALFSFTNAQIKRFVESKFKHSIPANVINNEKKI